MIISYCKYIVCVSILNIDMAETGETVAITLTIDGINHKVMTPECTAPAEITKGIDSIHECNKLLLINKDDLSKKDLDEAAEIIMSLLGTSFHPVANSLLQMKMNREKELAEREAQRIRGFMSAMTGIADSRKCLGW